MLNDKDRALIDKLVKQFRVNGVIRDEEDNTFIPIGTTEEIFEEAYQLAKSESELNPDFYDEEADQALDEIEDQSFNPMIDGYWD